LPKLSIGIRRAVIQALKAALACVLAWFAATHVFSLPQPFLAPYAAVFMIQSTVYRSIRVSVQQLAAVSAAVLISFVVVQIVPDRIVALGVVTAVGLLVGRLSVFGDSGRWVGVTAVLLLTMNVATQDVLLVDRLVETALGAVVGIVVNALILPPTYAIWARTATAELADELRDVLAGLASALRKEDAPGDPHHWVRRCEHAERIVIDAEDAVRWSREADRMNLRRRRGRRAETRGVRNLRDASPHVRQIAEALRSSVDPHELFRYPEREVRAALAALFDELAEVVRLSVAGQVERDAFGQAVADCRRRIVELEERLSTTPAGSPGVVHGVSGMLLPAQHVLRDLSG
jgi:uncharacterized membrane protein YgaE (UPF0421/DUF939 family)